MKRRLHIALALFLTLLMAGCAGRSTVAPVSERGVSSNRNHAGEGVRSAVRGYTVKRGDTLYSIAFRFGRDYRELATLNGIKPPYTIYVGQRIRLVSTVSGAPRAHTEPASRSAASAATSKPQPTATTTTTPVVAARPAPKAPATSRVAVQGPLRWQWPVEGPVLTRFNDSENGKKGIDIGGHVGQPIRTSAPGRVVYSGSGLRGYGQLIIVKHNDNYLSAYAHNRRLLAQEGDELAAGQVLAEMGRSETDRVMLHFEIRHDGKPVDPLLYLPKR